jgi:ribosomal protein L11 methyltransferase
MCLDLLIDADSGARRSLGLIGRRVSRSLCDLGCGSGVLAIAAAKLGFAPVSGIDVEQAPLEESDRNARLNYVEIELSRCDLRREPAPIADVATANLTAPLLECVGRAWAANGERPRMLIASGFLQAETDRVLAALAAAGLNETRRMIEGDWAALVLEAR